MLTSCLRLHSLACVSAAFAASQVMRLNRLPKATRIEIVESRVRRCIDLLNRPSQRPAGEEHTKGVSTCNISFQRSAFDGKLPPVAGWPQHPMAPVAPLHRFSVGDRVRVKTGLRLWQKGRITHLNYRDSRPTGWPPGMRPRADKVAPYRIELDMGLMITSFEDREDLIRPESEGGGPLEEGRKWPTQGITA